MTTQQKRKPPFWQLPGAMKKLPDGSEIREESLGADQVLLHVTFPAGTDTERISNFARAFTRELPKNVRAIFTEEDIRINIQRPRAVNLNISDNTIESDVLLEQIRRLVENQNIQTTSIFVQRNQIIQPSVKVTTRTPVKKKATSKKAAKKKAVRKKKVTT